MTLYMTDVLSLQKGLKIREEYNNEITIYDSRSGQIHELNESAAFILRLIMETNTIHDITKKYNIQYSLDSKMGESDVTSTLESLIELNVLGKR